MISPIADHRSLWSPFFCVCIWSQCKHIGISPQMTWEIETVTNRADVCVCTWNSISIILKVADGNGANWDKVQWQENVDLKKEGRDRKRERKRATEKTCLQSRFHMIWLKDQIRHQFDAFSLQRGKNPLDRLGPCSGQIHSFTYTQPYNFNTCNKFNNLQCVQNAHFYWTTD